MIKREGNKNREINCRRIKWFGWYWGEHRYNNQKNKINENDYRACKKKRGNISRERPKR